MTITTDEEFNNLTVDDEGDAVELTNGSNRWNNADDTQYYQ